MGYALNIISHQGCFEDQTFGVGSVQNKQLTANLDLENGATKLV